MNLSKAVLILRGYHLEQVDRMARILCEHADKIKTLEITLNTDNALSLIEKISEKYGDKMLIGAGTVLNSADVKDACSAGAKFVLSPVMLEKDAIDYCKSHDMLAIPAAMTPSEAYRMHCYGADAIKIFPARLVSLKFFNELKAPMEFLKLMAVGGISAANAKDFYDQGADYVGTASGIFKKEDILKNDERAMISSLKEFEAIMP